MPKRLRARVMQWRLECVVLVLLGMVRIGLWWLPFRMLQRSLAYLAQPGVNAPSQLDPSRIQRVASVVQARSRYVPQASCLTQALVAQVLLGRRGHAARLHIGVARGEAGRFEAHAWVECDNEVVIGDSEDLERYVRLPALDRVASSGY